MRIDADQVVQAVSGDVVIVDESTGQEVIIKGERLKDLILAAGYFNKILNPGSVSHKQELLKFLQERADIAEYTDTFDYFAMEGLLKYIDDPYISNFITDKYKEIVKRTQEKNGIR